MCSSKVFNERGHNIVELYITSRQVLDQFGKQRLFQYYLTVDHIEAGNFCFENYGVRITEQGIATQCLPALTTSAMRIDQLMTTLVDNTVGPAGLQDIIADWL